MEKKLANTSFIYLSTIGRKSGLTRRIEAWFAYSGGRIYMMGHKSSHWWRNIRANASVEIEIAEMKFKGLAKVDNDQINGIYDMFTQKYGSEQVKYWYNDHLEKRVGVVIEVGERIA